MLPLNETFYNKTKHILKDGGKVIGAWLQMASPVSAEILARVGYDFLLIDMEHGPGDIQTLIYQLQAMKGYEVNSIVRVPWNDFVTIKRVLDAGAHGIHVPYVNTKAEAEAAVRAVKYAPGGIRGIAGSPRACGYGLNTANYQKYANDEILLYIAIETPEAVDNLDEILTVEGIDGIFIGPNDLATSIGHFTNSNHPETQEAIRVVEQKVFGKGKFLGTVGGTFDKACELYEKGYQFVVTLSDAVTLSKVHNEFMSRIQKEYPLHTNEL